MALRSPRELFIQTLAFEIGGLVICVPLFVAVTGGGAGEGTVLMVALSVAMMLWSPLHNAVFDWAALKVSGRVASDRPHFWRAVHAISHEVTSIVLTLPIMLGLGGFTLTGAIWLKSA